MLSPESLHTPAKFQLIELPKDILVFRIFEYLPEYPDQFIILTRVCKLWREIICDEQKWKTTVIQQFNVKSKPYPHLSWMTNYAFLKVFNFALCLHSIVFK